MSRDEPSGERAGRTGTNERSPRSSLSRRTVLSGIASAGLVGSLVGAGTRANVSDTEAFADDVLSSGDVDLTVGWTVTEDEFVDDPTNVCSSVETVDREAPVVRIDDLEAGDEGSLLVCLDRAGGPAYLWTRLRLVADLENRLVRGEAASGDRTAREGELAEALEAAVWIAPGCEDADSASLSGTLAEVSDALEDGARVGSPATTEACLGLAWRLPEDVDATVRSDQVEVTLEFVGEQARHNDGENPWSDP